VALRMSWRSDLSSALRIALARSALGTRINGA
jgi:hypothetical protein